MGMIQRSFFLPLEVVARMPSAIEEFQTYIDGYMQELTRTVADLYNSCTMKSEEYEQILKHDYSSRAKTESNLEESATATPSFKI
mmetsp:Transcript_10791/g.18966  ORF Transcript_10791/g.18966 Transcript_10791/m.18966 type:complete len:85 (-) Transcript_10791:280-534(-)